MKVLAYSVDDGARAGMSALPDPEVAFAEFLAARHGDPDLDFEAWVRGRPGVTELRALHHAFSHLRSELPAGGDDVGNSLERGHEVLEELGAGGFGRVYRARDLVLQREVALKVLREDARVSQAMRRRFLEEARVLARLDHPNIVRVHAVSGNGEEIRLSLELVQGRTLEQIVEEDGPLAPEEAARVGADLCRALAAIHAAGLVHMDVKPGNVMRATGGRIVLLDFGFARAAYEHGGTGGSPVGGTPPFMSPEHFSGRTDLGPRSDLYSLGVLVYWLLAGRPPYEFTDFADLSAKVLAGRHVRLLDARPDVPPELAAVVERAMARDEDDRFASAGEMEAALRRFAGGSGPVVSAAAPRRATRRAVALALGAVAVLAAALWIVPRVTAAPRFELEYGLYRRLPDGGTERLGDGDAVRVGDSLFLRTRGDAAFYVYLFNQDDRGNWFRLLPRELSELYEPHVWHELPRGGRSWQVSHDAREENFYLVAAPQRVAFAEELARIVPATGRRVADFDADELENLRGSVRGVGVETGPADGARPEVFDLEAYFRDLGDRLDEAERVFTSRVRLRNEGL